MSLLEHTDSESDQRSDQSVIVLILSLPLKFFRIYVNFFKRRPLGAICSLIVLIMCVIGLFAPLLAPHDPLRSEPPIRNLPPWSEHWFGTDLNGRDLLSRVIYGSRLSLLIGVSSVIIGTLFGSIWGLVSGYWGGGFDLISQRLVEIWMSFPGIILAMTLLVIMGGGIIPVTIAISFGRVPSGTRVIRSVAIATREYTYVEAARAIGMSDARIIIKHVLPSCISSFLILSTANIGGGIIAEASLGFLGLGVPPPVATWGNMLSSNVLIALKPSWWLIVFPGLAIVITVLSFNLFGDALRDVLDPRLRGEH